MQKPASINIGEMAIQSFFDPATFTITHVVSDTATGQCAIIDPVLDFDAAAARTSTQSADKVISYVESEKLVLQWILETHAHADHLSSAPYLREKLGGQTAIGQNITMVQSVFSGVFNLGKDFSDNGEQFDRLLTDGEVIRIGTLDCKVISTPGHTPACVSYQVGNAVFIGDTLFMPDYGTARCDFPGGDAVRLYHSIRKILSLPKETRLFMCHDYQPGGREVLWETTVGEQLSDNVHVREGVKEVDFVKMRQARDAGLNVPALLIPSIQVNIRAGHLPSPENNGVSYLKFPVNKIG